MRILGTVLSVLVVVAGCGLTPAPRSQETDQIARVVAEAISHPRQEDAIGLARAAAGTRAVTSGELRVVEAKDLPGAGPQDPVARLVFRIQLESVRATGFGSDSPAVTACYDVEFASWGMVGSPRRRACPARTAAVSLPPPAPVRELPAGSETVLRRLVGGLPDAVEAAAAATAVREALPSAPAGALDPEVAAEVQGGDLGISVRAESGCLLGSRVGGAGGRVLVWRLSRVQRQPGELSCDPSTALGGAGLTPVH